MDTLRRRGEEQRAARAARPSLDDFDNPDEREKSLGAESPPRGFVERLFAPRGGAAARAEADDEEGLSEEEAAERRRLFEQLTAPRDPELRTMGGLLGDAPRGEGMPRAGGGNATAAEAQDAQPRREDGAGAGGAQKAQTLRGGGIGVERPMAQVAEAWFRKLRGEAAARERETWRRVYELGGAPAPAPAPRRGNPAVAR